MAVLPEGDISKSTTEDTNDCADPTNEATTPPEHIKTSQLRETRGALAHDRLCIEVGDGIILQPIQNTINKIYMENKRIT